MPHPIHESLQTQASAQLLARDLSVDEARRVFDLLEFIEYTPVTIGPSADPRTLETIDLARRAGFVSIADGPSDDLVVVDWSQRLALRRGAIRDELRTQSSATAGTKGGAA